MESAELIRRFAAEAERAGLVTRAQLEEAWRRGGNDVPSLLRVLAALGIEAGALTDVCASALGLGRLPAGSRVDPSVPAAVRDAFRALGGAAFHVEQGTVQVAFCDPRYIPGARATAPVAFQPWFASEHEWMQLDGAQPAEDARLVETAVAAPLAQGAALLPAADPFGDTLAAAGQPAPAAPEVIPELTGFAVERPLGRGGMAEVFLARDARTGAPVALKRMMPHLATQPDFAQRFVREARTTAALQHPNIVALLGFGRVEGTLAVAFEFMDGGTLQELLKRVGRLPSAAVLVLARAVLAGLAHAHAHGVVHRDIKPANVMLSTGGAVKLTDFGIAKSVQDVTMTAADAIMGTPAYMAPEQLTGRTADPRTDLFSAGTLIFEMITGVNPFVVPDNPSATLKAISDVAFPPVAEQEPAVHPALEVLVEALLRRDPAARPGSAADALALVDGLAQAVEAHHPRLVAGLVADAPTTCTTLRAEQGREEFTRAGALWEQGRRAASALAAHRAALLCPADAQVAAALQAACAGGPFSMTPSSSPAARDAREALRSAPDAPGLLKRAADVARADGCILEASLLLRRYLRARPADSVAQLQLGELMGVDAGQIQQELRAPASSRLGTLTLAMVAGLPQGGGIARTSTVVTTAVAGDLVAAEDAARPAAAAAPPLGEQLQDFWRLHRVRLVLGAAVLAAALVAVKWTGRMINRSVTHVQGGLQDLPDRVLEDPAALYGGRPAADAPVQAAEAALAAGRVDEALKAYDAILASPPGGEAEARARLGRARAYLVAGRGAEARPDLEAVKRLVPDRHPAHQQAVRALSLMR